MARCPEWRLVGAWVSKGHVLAGGESLVECHRISVGQIDGDCNAFKPCQRRNSNDHDGISFLMKDREMEVPCRATLDLLAVRFDSGATPDGHEQTFFLHRGAIEQ